ncbi:MAG: hypothetical protein DRJ42_28495 [Deltaproteobacteria bacterium]|nr:MAG: hypothetical protein DRJ42_28495 [Deltaproteobacteria bacterium]
MFKEVLQGIVDNTEGGVAGLIMDYDGITLDKYIREGETLDVETVGMEYSVILKDVRRASEMLEAGSMQEIAIKAEKMTTVIRYIDETYFVAVALRPDGNFGKARFRLRTAAGVLQAELS